MQNQSSIPRMFISTFDKMYGEHICYMTPVQKGHTNCILNGSESRPEILPLPITKVNFFDNNGMMFLYSWWKIDSWIARLKFLFNGEICIGVMGKTQPPICIFIEKKPILKKDSGVL